MTALTASYDTEEKDGKLQAQPVGAAKKIFQGSLTVTVDTTGILEAGTDASGKMFAGVAYEPADNTGGAAGAISCRVQKRGSFLYPFTGSTPTAAVIGKKAYISDSGTVALAATTANDIYCGDIVGFDGAKVRLRIDRAAA